MQALINSGWHRPIAFCKPDLVLVLSAAGIPVDTTCAADLVSAWGLSKRSNATENLPIKVLLHEPPHSAEDC